MDFRGARSGCHGNVTEIKAVIFQLFHLFTYNFARFGRFGRFGRFARFACFGRFGGFASLVSVISFRPFRFVVSGFRTCLNAMRNQSISKHVRYKLKVSDKTKRCPTEVRCSVKLKDVQFC